MNWINRLLRPYQRLGIVTKVTLVFSVLVLLATVVVGYLVFAGNSRLVVESARERLTHNSQVLGLQFSATVYSLNDDLKFLSKDPSFQSFMRQTEKQAQTQPVRSSPDEPVTRVFTSLLESRPAYLRVSFVSNATDSVQRGHELIRVDQVEGILTPVPPENLENLVEAPLFKTSVDVLPDNIFISNVDLFEQNGAVHQPAIPAVTAAMPVYGTGNTVIGLLVIELDLSATFNILQSLADPHTTLYLTNNLGDYLLHPDSSRTFGFRKGRRWLMQEDFPPVAAVLNGDQSQLLLERTEAGGQEEVMLNVDRVYLFNDHDRFLTLGLSVPYDQILAGVRDIRNRSLSVTLLICMAGILLTLFFSRFLIQPLHDITRAVSAFAAGESESPPAALELPQHRHDEIGTLAKTFQAMAERLNRQIQELRSAKQAAEEANKAKDEFLSVISHEIRTPMNAVIGMTRLLMQNKPDPKQLPILHTLQFSSDNLMSLINDILDFSKIQAGKVTFESIDFNLKEVLNKIIQSHLPRADEKELDLSLETEAGIPEWVCGDSVRLFQILNNLVGNAIKFTETGHVRVGVSQVRQPNDPNIYLKFLVIDTGIGIAQDRMSVIFERFTQASSDTTRKYGGSGLGLAITKNLVEMQGGSIRLESEFGKGSRVEVLLTFQPSAVVSTIADTPAPINDPTALQGLRVLYVEDVAYNQFLIENYLAPYQITLRMASSGAEGIALAQSTPFDLILMDIQMPDMDGYETTERIRQFNPDVPIIAVTAQVAEQSRELIFASGMNDYILKPVDQDELLRKMAWYTKRKVSEARKSAVATPAIPAPQQPVFTALEEAYDYVPAKIRRALQMIRTEMETYHDQFSKAIRQKDPTDFGRQYHKITPHVRLLQLSALDEQLTECRRLLADPTADTSGLVLALQARFRELITHIDQKIREVEQQEV
jgi:signal transduction histidine kinase/DNA-binding response OmpR family regulator